MNKKEIKVKKKKHDFKWQGTKEVIDKCTFYQEALIDGVKVKAGGDILLAAKELYEKPYVCQIQYMFQDKTCDDPKAHARGIDMLLRESRNDQELFFLDSCDT